MTPFERDLRADLKAGRIDYDQALDRVDAELKRSGDDASLLVVRGILILLSENLKFELTDARVSFERAIATDPESAEAYEELGRYFDVFEPDRKRAEELYRLALAKGAGADCQESLDELLAEREAQ